MKKALILLLGLASYSCVPPGDKWKRYDNEMIWVNQSDHTIQFVARAYRDILKPVEVVLHDETLQKGEKFGYRQGGGYNYTPRPEDLPFSRITVRFDELPEVPYTQTDIEANPYRVLSPPEGYPAEHGFLLGSSYEKEVIVTDRGYLTTYSFTYTFTDADYEAAREWAESQP